MLEYTNEFTWWPKHSLISNPSLLLTSCVTQIFSFLITSWIFPWLSILNFRAGTAASVAKILKYFHTDCKEAAGLHPRRAGPTSGIQLSRPAWPSRGPQTLLTAGASIHLILPQPNGTITQISQHEEIVSHPGYWKSHLTALPASCLFHL